MTSLFERHTNESEDARVGVDVFPSSRPVGASPLTDLSANQTTTSSDDGAGERASSHTLRPAFGLQDPSSSLATHTQHSGAVQSFQSTHGSEFTFGFAFGAEPRAPSLEGMKTAQHNAGFTFSGYRHGFSGAGPPPSFSFGRTAADEPVPEVPTVGPTDSREIDHGTSQRGENDKEPAAFSFDWSQSAATNPYGPMVFAHATPHPFQTGTYAGPREAAQCVTFGSSLIPVPLANIEHRAHPVEPELWRASSAGDRSEPWGRLHRDIIAGDVPACESLLREGIDSWHPMHGLWALQSAAEAGHVGVVGMLLGVCGSCAQASMSDAVGLALMAAANKRRLAVCSCVMDEYAEFIRPGALDDVLCSVLDNGECESACFLLQHGASAYRALETNISTHPEICELVLTHGNLSELHDGRGLLLLLRAAARCGRFDLIASSLAHRHLESAPWASTLPDEILGPVATAGSEEAVTAIVTSLRPSDSALHDAMAASVLLGRLSIARLLHQAGAPPTLPNVGHDCGRVSSLHAAARRGEAELVRELLSAGADVNAVGVAGETALHDASSAGHDAIAAVLIASGATVDKPCRHGETPLHLAAKAGQDACVALLVSHGAAIAADDTGCTPLHSAAENGHEAICRLLLRAGACAGSRDKQGVTPLQRAAQRGYAATCAVLLRHGADVNVANHRQETALVLACKAAQVDSCRVLLAFGASQLPSTEHALAHARIVPHSVTMAPMVTVLQRACRLTDCQLNDSDSDGVTGALSAYVEIFVLLMRHSPPKPDSTQVRLLLCTAVGSHTSSRLLDALLCASGWQFTQAELNNALAAAIHNSNVEAVHALLAAGAEFTHESLTASVTRPAMWPTLVERCKSHELMCVRSPTLPCLTYLPAYLSLVRLQSGGAIDPLAFLFREALSQLAALMPQGVSRDTASLVLAAAFMAPFSPQFVADAIAHAWRRDVAATVMGTLYARRLASRTASAAIARGATLSLMPIAVWVSILEHMLGIPAELVHATLVRPCK